MLIGSPPIFVADTKIIYCYNFVVLLKHLYRKELDKAFFDLDAAYSDRKDLAKRRS